MHCIRRSCQSALFTLEAGRPLASGSRRPFSRSSARRRGTLPQFLEPSSAELGTLLGQLNARILLPEHLTAEQRKLVYHPDNKARLEAEPIEMTLGDVTLPLEHLDRYRDMPNRWQTLRAILAQSKTAHDWENVLRMLDGLRDAGIHLSPSRLEMVVRKLNEAGMHHLVLKALQRAAKTGLTLKHRGVAERVLHGLHDKAAASGWAEPETTKALSFAEHVVELMDDDHHLGSATPAPGDPRTSPFVIAVPLELAAATAKRHAGGHDRHAKVRTYASRLTNALLQDDFHTAVLPEKLTELSTYQPSNPATKKFIQLADIRTSVYNLVILWNALRTAREVLGAEMPLGDAAQQAEKELREGLERGQTALEELGRARFPNKFDYVGALIKRCEEL